MLELYKNIRNKRHELGLTQAELAARTGYADKSMIAKIEKGAVDLTQTKIAVLADALGVTPGELMGVSNHSPSPVPVPVLGRVPAGIPLEAIEDVTDTEEITPELAASGKFFGLKVSGNSMEPRICDGDVVIVRQQDDADTGDVVIALVNGSDATCKKLKKFPGGIMLLSNNPSYEPMVFSMEDIERKPVKIIGKVVELRAKF